MRRDWLRGRDELGARLVGGCACRLMPLGGVARQSTKVERRVDPPKTLQTTSRLVRVWSATDHGCPFSLMLDSTQSYPLPNHATPFEHPRAASSRALDDYQVLHCSVGSLHSRVSVLDLVTDHRGFVRRCTNSNSILAGDVLALRHWPVA